MMKDNFKKFLRSFKYAFKGIIHTIKTEQNMRFHIIAAIAVLWISRFYDFSKAEYAVIILTIGFVMACEIFNTSAENIVDLYSTEKSKHAEIAKDTAAGAVLVSALAAIGVAVFMFWDFTAFTRIYAYFTENPIRILIPVLYACFAVWFIFHTHDRTTERINK